LGNNQTLREIFPADSDHFFFCRPCPNYFCRTLHEIFKATPWTLLKLCEPINRTLIEIFLATFAGKFFQQTLPEIFLPDPA